MDLRVALIGSHGTGKTSIVNKIAEITNLILIDEIARKYNMNTSDMGEYKIYQRKILTKQIKTENEHILSCGNFISDRSTIDNMAYYLLKCKDVTTFEERQRYCEIAIGNIEKYSHLFYVPIEFTLRDDKFRFLDKKFQHQVDEEILAIISHFKLNVHFISGSLDQRVSKILEVIKW